MRREAKIGLLCADVTDRFAGENGNLRAEYAADGVRLRLASYTRVLQVPGPSVVKRFNM